MTTSRKPAPRGTGPQEDAAKLFEVNRTGRDDIPAQIRRRRAASYRCEPMAADGRRDPLSKPLSDSVSVVWFEIGPRNTAAVSGHRVVPGILKLEIPYQWHPYRRDVICIPVDRADELITYFERRCRRRVQVEAVDRI